MGEMIADQFLRVNRKKEITLTSSWPYFILNRCELSKKLVT
jgi:hypothetical protein